MVFREKWFFYFLKCFHRSYLLIMDFCLKAIHSQLEYLLSRLRSSQMQNIIFAYKCFPLMTLILHLKMPFQNNMILGKSSDNSPVRLWRNTLMVLDKFLSSHDDELIMESFRIKIKILVHFEMCHVIHER